MPAPSKCLKRRLAKPGRSLHKLLIRSSAFFDKMAFASTLSTAERGVPQRFSQSSSMDSVQGGSSANTDPEESQPRTAFEEVQSFLRFREQRNERSTHVAGYPRLAAECVQWPNFQFCNGFIYERWRLLLSTQARLMCLSDQLLAYDKKNPDHVKGLTANHQRPAGQPQVMDEYELILAEIFNNLEKMDRLSTGIRMADQLPVMHREQWGDHLEHIYGKLVDKNACNFLFVPQDLRAISKAPQPPRWVFRVSAYIIRLYNRYFKSNKKHEYDYIPMEVLVVIFTAVHVLVAASLILVPAGAMFLPDLDKTQLFVIIAVAFSIFCLVMSAKKEIKPNMTILAATAYMAFCGAFAFANGGGSLV